MDQFPTKVYFGEGSVAKAFEAELGKAGETVMLAYGGGSLKKNGIYREMKTLLEKAGKRVVDFPVSGDSYGAVVTASGTGAE